MPGATLGCHLNHWGGVTHIYISKLTIIGSDTGMSSDRCQAIIWTNAGIYLIGISEMLSKIRTFLFTKMHMNILSVKWRQFCFGLNVLFYHDVGEISYLSQSEAPNLVMWRVRVMQLMTPSPWIRGHSWHQFNVQEIGPIKCHWKHIAGQD